jgi:KaiC/GvpD/RAD55 family RecA-like ATPase
MSARDDLEVSSSRLATGIAGLDSMLGGGFSEGRVILLLGEPGTGKTILSSQFLFAGASKGDGKSMLIGMNEPKSRFLSEMKSLGMNFEKLESDGKFAYVDATDVRRIPEQAKVGRIPVGGRELGLVNLIDTIEEAIQKYSPKRIAVDSISDLVFRYPKIEERRPVVLDLVETLQTAKATCLMTSELLSTGDERMLQPEEYLAEGVILLRTIQRGTRSIQVLKMRGSKIDTKPRPYAIRADGIEVYSTEELY